MTIGVGNNPNLTIGGMSMAGMDIETLLMAVQSQRVNLLDNQLNNQIAQVQQRNDNIAHLNDALSAFTAIQNKYGSGAKPDDKLPSGSDTKAVNDALKAAGITDMNIDGNTTYSTIQSAVTKLKGLIDGQSNSQQMDMLRLQSLTNKRNEAFDIMTNFVKKMSDSRSSIIGNMR